MEEVRRGADPRTLSCGAAENVQCAAHIPESRVEGSECDGDWGGALGLLSMSFVRVGVSTFHRGDMGNVEFFISKVVKRKLHVKF